MALQLGEKHQEKKKHTALSECNKTHIGNTHGAKLKRKNKMIKLSNI